jgi:hypothetical protein
VKFAEGESTIIIDYQQVIYTIAYGKYALPVIFLLNKP